MKTYYNVNNISFYDAKTGKWLRGREAIKHMRCIRSGDSNWELYLDEKSGHIYYVAVVPDCYSGFWGTVKHFKKRYGHDHDIEKRINDYYWEQLEENCNGYGDPRPLEKIKEKFGVALTWEQLHRILAENGYTL